MPTFASIGVHPQLRETLAKVKPPIETPQALLSRDPLGLAQAVHVPINQIMELRSAIADALVSKEIHGRRALHIKATLEHYPAATSRVDSTVDEGESGFDNDGKLQLQQHDDSLILGSVSALDLGLYESLCFDRHRALSTGSNRLDELLSPPAEFTNTAVVHPLKKQQQTVSSGEDSSKIGMPFGYVTQVTGPPACGKTQLALMVSALHASKEPGPSVFYLASGVGHATLILARRMNHFCQRTKNANPINGVNFFNVSNGYEALSALSEIEAKIQQRSVSQQKQGTGLSLLHPRVLIVFDSASGCLSGDLYSAGDGGAGVSLAREVAWTLKRLARQHGAAVLVTNGTVSAEKHSLKAAMGQSWKAADLKLWLKVVEDAGQDVRQSNNSGICVSQRKIISATLEQHPAKAVHGKKTSEITANFAITASGISDWS